VRDRQFTLGDAFVKADAAMYEMKREHHQLVGRL
jgi:hypothetical protein